MSDIVLVEDEEVLRRSLGKTLERLGHAVRTAPSAEAAQELLAEGPPDLLITDFRLPGMSGHELLLAVKGAHPHVAVIVITAHGTIDDAVAAMREGAADYLRKPIDLQELGIVVDRCLKRENLRRELDYYRTRDLAVPAQDGILGSSVAAAQLRSVVAKLAALQKRDGTGATILLTGETGTGKGLTARAIHNASPQRDAPFIEVNCTAIPDNLLEAELMGYERGAFTDATASKPGLFEAAEGGTIFFDEIGHMNTALQAKLLKVIDEKKVRRLGSTRDRVVRARIMTATHMDLAKRVAEGKFLEDLYHRIHVIKLELPPLRSRGDDILELAEHFVAHHCSEYGLPKKHLTAGALAALREYPWPGNVRELAHAIERAVVMSSGDSVDGSDLALPATPTSKVGVSLGAEDGVSVDFSRGAVDIEEIEADLIRKAMAFTDGNQVKAARLLGLSRDALRYRLEKFGLR
jgi:two-component system response regulator AtoC